MEKRRRWLVLGILGLPFGLLFGLIWIAAVAVAATPDLETVVLYDGGLGTLPGEQGFDYVTYPPLGPTQVISQDGTILNTLGAADYYAGYFGRSELVPVLDRTVGFTLTFKARVLQEVHNTPHRAGFSIIVLGDDAGGTEPVEGIELAFWTNEIWVQDDDRQGGTLFTHAEGVFFNTSAMTTYELAIVTDTYRLAANGVPVLSGRVRDYSNFSGFPDPYEIPNLLFLGDDTSSARARIKLDEVRVAVPVSDAGLEPRQFLPLLTGAGTDFRPNGERIE